MPDKQLSNPTKKARERRAARSAEQFKYMEVGFSENRSGIDRKKHGSSGNGNH